MENVLTLETKSLQIKVENFEGPLDLLCHLIDKNKMDIYDINLDAITDQYLEYINKLKEQKLGISSEFLVMASSLILIKSKGLLPNPNDQEEEELTEEELIRRIVEYKRYKEITASLKELYNTYSDTIFRGAEKIELPKQTLEKTYESQMIVNLYEDILEKFNVKVNVNSKNIEKIAIRETYTVSSKVKEIFKALLKKPRIVFNKMYTGNKAETVTALTGLLELSRRKKVKTEQNELFGDIIVEKRKKDERYSF